MRNRATWPHATRVARRAALPMLLACSSKPLPDPRVAVQRWADAVEKGDSEAVHALLTEDARRSRGESRVAELLKLHHKELTATGQATASPQARLETVAELSLPHDSTATVVVEEGRFRVAAAGALPAAASTPLDAVRELREVLARRSYAGLLRVLSGDTAGALEGGVKDLVDALEEPSALEIAVDGRRATARIPGGHQIELVREDGVWRVKDFD